MKTKNKIKTKIKTNKQCPKKSTGAKCYKRYVRNLI